MDRRSFLAGLGSAIAIAPAASVAFSNPTSPAVSAGSQALYMSTDGVTWTVARTPLLLNGEVQFVQFFQNSHGELIAANALPDPPRPA